MTTRLSHRTLLRAIARRIDIDYSPISIPYKILVLSDIYDVESDKLLFKSHKLRCGKWSDDIKMGDTIEFEARIVEKESTKKLVYGMDCGKTPHILNPKNVKILSSRYGESE